MVTTREPAEGLSHVRGGTEPPLLDNTIGQALTDAAQRWPDLEAIISVAEGARLTFSQLDDSAVSLAAGLLALGLRPGDRIGIWSPNNLGWVRVQCAAAKAGLILVTINPAYRLGELEHALEALSIKAIVCAERFKTSEYCTMLETLVPELAAGGLRHADGRFPALRHAITLEQNARPGWSRLDDIASLATDALRLEIAAIGKSIAVDDPANVQFTSGTTGLPKGATLTHRNILNNGFMVGHAVGLRAGDRLCVPVPLYHCFGLVMGSLACLTHGAAMILPAAGFDAQSTLEAIERERCTQLYGVPTMFIAMLGHERFARTDVSSLRGGCMAGAPCPQEVMRQVIDRMNMRAVTIAYGMTETSPVSFQTGAEDSLDHRISTVGRIQPHLESKIVGPDGETLPVGEAGELCTRGYSVMHGYWGDAEQTARALDAAGWMHSGDLATIDAQGYCRIVGRIKDMIIRGGENIYPREIEEYLYRHPDVEDVAVVGIADDHFGEEVCAWVRLRAGATLAPADIIDFCRGQIAHFKIPRYVEIVDAFPCTVTGKVQKYRIREIMHARLADEAEAIDPVASVAAGDLA